ncbi:MAG TPA: MlaD family protein, partial [Acidimicrobiales bacterium]|nr:MlaD family protein [Acidimicrobiales bacterium]
MTLRAVLGRAVAALVFAGLVALWIARPGPERYTVSADFNRAGLNIRAGDEVRVRGFPIGTVTRIETDRRDFSARYVLSIDRDVRIKRDSTARIVPKTLFGDKYVELEPAAKGEPAMGDGGHIGQDRTKTVTEFQQVLDRFTPALQAVDPGQLGGTIQAMAAGIGDGTGLGRTAVGFGTAFQEIGGRQDDIARLLRHIPGTAETFGDRAGDMTAAAGNLGRVAEALAENEPTLGRFLRENADLLTQAAELVTTEKDRFQRLTEDGFDVLRMVAAHPGSIKGFMEGQAGATVGLPSVTHYGVMFAGVRHMMVTWPTPRTSEPIDDGDTAIGPDVEILYPAPPGG